MPSFELQADIFTRLSVFDSPKGSSNTFKTHKNVSLYFKRRYLIIYNYLTSKNLREQAMRVIKKKLTREIQTEPEQITETNKQRANTGEDNVCTDSNCREYNNKDIDEMVDTDNENYKELKQNGKNILKSTNVCNWITGNMRLVSTEQ